MKTWKQLLGAGTVLWAVAASQCNPSNQYVNTADQGGSGKGDMAGTGTSGDMTGSSSGDMTGSSGSDLANNPLSLTLITPAVGTSAGNIPLTFTGTGFMGLVTVTINGQVAGVTQMTPTQLTVNLPAAVGTKGKATVMVRNGDGTTLTKTDLFSYYYGSLKFNPAITVTAGTAPYAVAIGEMNNNAQPDLIVVNNIDNNVGVLLGNGNGTFQTMATQPTGNRPRGLALVDFNKDNYPDVVTVNYAANSISTFTNDKMGVLGGRVDIPLGTGMNPVGIDAKVVTGSTYPDVVTANSATDDVTFFQSKTAGGLNTPQSYSSIKAPSAVIFADVNADTYPDIIVANQFSGNCSVYLGTGSGGFGLKGSFSAGTGPAGVAAGDFDGDGKVDLLVSLGSDNKVALLVGNGDGTFKTPTSYAAGTQPGGIALGDFNGDGKPDIATALSGDFAVAILLNTNNLPGAPLVLTAGSGPMGVAIGDVNNDGKLDVVVANSAGTTLSVFLNQSQ